MSLAGTPRPGNPIEIAAALLSAFRGRSDVIAVQNGKGFEPRTLAEPIKPEDFARDHLEGRVCLGFYVLTSDSRVWCACADFDNKPENPDLEWRQKAETLYFWLVKAGLSPLVEISQSGEAAHDWLFLEAATDAWIPRAFFRNACTKLGIRVPEIYPKQDVLTGKGLGNLIRYPLWNRSRFADPEDEWSTIEPLEALAAIKRTSGEELKRLAHELAMGEMRAEKPVEHFILSGTGCNGNELPPRVKAKLERKGTLLHRRWHGDRSGMTDQTTSAVVLSIGCELVRQLIPTPEIEAALRYWCREHDYEKGETDRAISRALSAAYEYVALRGGHAGGGTANADQATREENSPDVHLTDLGNARRVVAHHGVDLRFCHPQKSWYVWDGSRWKVDDTARALRLVKVTQGGLYQWAAGKIQELSDALKDEEPASLISRDAPENEDEDKKAQLAALTSVLKHCLKWEDARRISACLKLAESEPNIPILPADLDKDHFLLNCLNGTVDLRTGTLRAHRREDYITKIAVVDYQPDAACPLWDKCLQRWMDGNVDLIHYLQRAVGYALTGDVSEQCLFFLYGSGQNGKTTFLGAILDLLGDYAIQTVAELLVERKHDPHPTERADLCGRRFVATIETDEGKRMAEALMKQMTGGDKIRARQMRQDFFEFWPTHKFFLAANHKPVIQGTDLGTWRRIKLVPFTVAIPDEEKDPKLSQKLKVEQAGILAWAVRGCLDWQKHGLGEPDEVRQATAAYREEEDAIAGFLAECCLVHREVKTQATVLLDAYQKWSGDKSMTTKGLKNRMEEKGCQRKKEPAGIFYLGIGLKGQPTEESECRDAG